MGGNAQRIDDSHWISPRCFPIGQNHCHHWFWQLECALKANITDYRICGRRVSGILRSRVKDACRERTIPALSWMLRAERTRGVRQNWPISPVLFRGNLTKQCMRKIKSNTAEQCFNVQALQTIIYKRPSLYSKGCIVHASVWKGETHLS